MRTLFVISNLEFGGAQRQLVELANAADPARCDLHICSLSDYIPLAEHLKHRERLHVIRKRFKFDVTVVPRLARLLRRLGADVVHGCLFDAEIAARLAARIAGTPVVVGSERNTDYRLKRRQLLAYRLTRGLVDIVIANSRAGADFNSRTLGMSRDRYRVVHNGVDCSRFRAPQFRSQARAAIRRELGVREDRPVVGMFASFKHQKNHPSFFTAAQRVLSAAPNCLFMLVGDELYRGMHGSDVYKEGIERLVDDLGLRSHCLFLGNRADVERLYPVCDLTVLPSHFEGTPNVLLESMACGVPVVATEVSDNAYIVPQGRAGFLVALGDDRALAESICRLLADEPLRERLGAQARDWVEDQFSLARLAANTTAVYEEALDAKLSNGVRHAPSHPTTGKA